MTIVMRVIVLLALAATGCTAPAGAPVATGPGTLQAARKYLEGRWTLISFEVSPPNTAPIQLKGQGTLSYDAFGNLDMQIRVSDDRVADELARAGVPLTDGVISTTGRTAVDMQARTLTYFLEGQSQLVDNKNAAPLATSRPRYWVVEGNVLTLTVKGDDGRPLSVGRWQKAK